LEKAPKRQKTLIRWRLFIHWLWIGVMALYWALADYGRNFVVPAIWLGLSVPFSISNLENLRTGVSRRDALGGTKPKQSRKHGAMWRHENQTVRQMAGADRTI
jgi:hypothetical protein